MKKDKIQICFKTVLYGDSKGEVLAVYNNAKNGMFDTFVLFEGHSKADIGFIRGGTKNSTPKEYQTTLTQLKKYYNTNDLEIVISLKY